MTLDPVACADGVTPQDRSQDREIPGGATPMQDEWFARPVLHVADVERTLGFYVNRLGFAESWRHAEDGKLLVAQAARSGCALIFSSQWPEKIGKGLVFISLGDAALLDRLRTELQGKGADVQEGWWGYRLLVVRDPDGNELYFNYPS
jgi:catechol 2,3-dioxygenase-like lactoylglutathione lyase family enzyme